MTRKQQRMAAIAAVLCGAGIAASLSLYAMRNSVTYFKTPSDLKISAPAPEESLRLGGVVAYGTVEKKGLETRFVVTDLKNDVDVDYTGVVPDLFKEGKGVVAIGTYDGRMFHARQILAKHDENYMPPPVTKALNKNMNKNMNKPAEDGAKTAR